MSLFIYMDFVHQLASASAMPLVMIVLDKKSGKPVSI